MQRGELHVREVFDGDTVGRDMDLGGSEPSRRGEPGVVRRRQHGGGVHVDIVAGAVRVVLETHHEPACCDAPVTDEYLPLGCVTWLVKLVRPTRL